MGRYDLQKVFKKDWENARLNKKNIFLTMANSRMGTKDTVIQGIQNEDINSLSELCVAMLVSEAVSINPSDIPHMQRKVQQYLLKSGIPEEFV